MVHTQITHCKRGHKRTPETTYTAPKTGAVACRICRSITRPDPVRKKRYQDRFLFGGHREEAIIRDGEKCVSCGMTRGQHREEFGRDITVDHIDGRGRYTPKQFNNNDLSNLQTLCLRCHGHKDRVRHLNNIAARKELECPVNQTSRAKEKLGQTV